MFYINFFYKMIANSHYVKYLQNILQDNHISYQSQQQFQKTNLQKSLISQKSAVLKGPLKTNLQGSLKSNLIQRYSRQMLLKQIGYQGQLKIINSKIAVIGAGGIGCPLSIYLAAAGIGTLGIFDSDTVDTTNLHRQIGHRTDRVGMQKTQSLKLTIQGINPHVIINKHPFITVQNASTLDSYDLIIDGSDNPTCRYIVNDYCMNKGKKLLSGACIGWQTQITCYGGDNLCYRCLWGNDQVSLGGCSSLGVVGMVPGIVGMILGIQAIKLVLNGQSSVEGKLLTYDGRKCEFKKIALRKKHPECIGCGENKLDMKVYNYSKYGGCATMPPPPKVDEVEWQQFLNQKGQNRQILDVRPTNLYNIVHLLNSQNIPFDILNKMTKEEIQQKLGKIETNQAIPVSCVRGMTSRHAVKYLNSIGFKAYSIIGGILAYKQKFDHNIPEL